MTRSLHRMASTWELVMERAAKAAPDRYALASGVARGSFYRDQTRRAFASADFGYARACLAKAWRAAPRRLAADRRLWSSTAAVLAQLIFPPLLFDRLFLLFRKKKETRKFLSDAPVRRLA
jgi:hypothetical protein